MSVMKRVRDISVATLNDRLEKSQDPVRMIDEFLYNQRQHIQETEKLIQQCAQHAASMRQQALSAEQTAEKRAEQAKLALKAGEEHVARMALQDKIANEEKAEQFRQLYEQAQHSLLELEEQMHQLRSDYQEVVGKRQYYAARLESVRLRQRMNERMSAGGGLSGNVFQRLEEKISDLELESRSLHDLRQAGREALYRAGSQTQALLEKELARLKQKLQEGER
ncbi:PspA/IM30 family protein [Xylanibacillus composti]|uniref:Phage shock protein A n=1 Tax=Xylanibacillus composti TaxID=1572762 RepID=A0A8J4H013_9BACL|nr:PspA/IM30 family protein [Xylanibacillus composti]MDT9723579.1 PspA/IM30 family protein [Xylanibacillus composti]GIQ68383.1 phage shock protein A [Xylanibacillus composti]